MLQLPVTPMPALTAGPSPALSVSAVSPAPATAGRSADGASEPASLLERVLMHAQDVQDASTQQLSRHLDQLDSGRISTSDMLRLQADMGAFAVQVQMTVRVADETGRAIQTLSQRS
jgi:hypothetical protein